MKQVTAYETHDKKLFKTEAEAKKSERHQWHETSFGKAMEKCWKLSSISPDDLMEFFDGNEGLILQYFKSKKADK